MGETDRIEAEVEKRKKRAWELQLPQKLFSWYEEQARWYPAWTSNSPTFLPSQIVGAAANQEGVSFSVGQKLYAFEWKEDSYLLPDGDMAWVASLRLRIDDRVVFALRASGSFDDIAGVVWKPIDVEAFVESPWVKLTLRLIEDAQTAYGDAIQAAKNREREDPKRLAELKRNFGIGCTTKPPEPEGTRLLRDGGHGESKTGFLKWVFGKRAWRIR